MKVAVVGVPKTIDNDILLMDKTFGFDTAVEEAQRAINSSYIEVLYVHFTCPCMDLCFSVQVFLLNCFIILVFFFFFCLNLVIRHTVLIMVLAL